MDLHIKAKMIRYAEDLTLNEFAENCGLSSALYGRIERNETHLSKKSQDKIEAGCERLGYKLLDDGVIKSQKTYIELSGANKMHALFDDIQSYIGHGGELLIDGADESKTPVEILSRVKELRANGMRMRHMVEEGDRHLRAPLNEYRWIPKHLFINQAIFIYLDNVALLSVQEDKIFIHRDKIMSRHLRNVFNERWDRYDQPDYTEADDVFDV